MMLRLFMAMSLYLCAGVCFAQEFTRSGSAEEKQLVDEARRALVEQQNALPALQEGEIPDLDKFRGKVVAITGPKECVVAIVNVTKKSKFVVISGVDTKDLTTDGPFPLTIPFKVGPTKSMGVEAYRILRPLTKAEVEKELEINTFRKWKGVTGNPTYKFTSADEKTGNVTLSTEDGKKRVVEFKKLPKEEQDFVLHCMRMNGLLAKVK